MCIVGTIGSAFVLLRYVLSRLILLGGCSVICSHELDRVCDLVNVIVFLN